MGFGLGSPSPFPPLQSCKFRPLGRAGWGVAGMVSVCMVGVFVQAGGQAGRGRNSVTVGVVAD